jgi:hypothetical protein
MDYVKNIDGTFDEVNRIRRIDIQVINERIQLLKDQKAAMPDLDDGELRTWAKANHPYYITLRNINSEIDNLQGVKSTLQAL